MKVQPKEIVLMLSFMILCIFLGILAPMFVYVIGSIPVRLEFTYVLIPLSIVFGWPVIVGLAVGHFLSAIFFSSLTWYRALSVFGIFLASLLAWRVGRLKMSFHVNVIAIIGAMIGVVALAVPWWAFNAGVGENVLLDFTVYPGWFGGDLGVFANLTRLIAQFLPIDGIEQIILQRMNDLAYTLLFVSVGSAVALVGAFLRGRKGRMLITVGIVACVIGILYFYSSFSQSMASLGVSAIGSTSVQYFGTVFATWGWTTGMYLSIIAVVLLGIAVALHSYMPEIKPSRFLGCMAATTVMVVLGALEDTIFFHINPGFASFYSTADRVGHLFGLALFTFVAINIVGYMIVAVTRKS